MSQPPDETAATATAAAGGEPEAPEIVSEFPAPPAFFELYRAGADAGPPPPEPMAPTYHMFGSPYSTQDVVPDLLPQDGKKLYAAAGEADGGIPVDYKAQMKKCVQQWRLSRCRSSSDGTMSICSG